MNRGDLPRHVILVIGPLMGLICLLLVPLAAAPGGQTSHALVLDDPGMPDYDAGLETALKAALASAGYDVMTADAEELAAPNVLDKDRCDLLVLPDAQHLPAMLIPAFTGYVLRGGDLIVLGAPAWLEPTEKGADGRWHAPGEESAGRALTPPATPFLDFTANFPVDSLVRETDAEQTATTAVTVPTGAGPGQVVGALHVVIPNLTDWDLWRTPDLATTPFQPGQTLTVLSAKGGPNTHELAVEWDDRDGSRWIAVIPLTEQWQRYTLAPADFHAWQVSPDSRVQAGFDPAQALRFKAGLDFSHTGRTGGPQEYWIAGVGTEAVPSGTEAVPSGAAAATATPILDTISPAYKFSPLHCPLTLATPPGEALAAPQAWANVDPSAWNVTSSPPRPGAAGFGTGRGWRWQPLLVARDVRTGQWRGTPATLFIHKPDGGGIEAGGVWASFAVTDSAFYRQLATLTLIGDIARRMRGGIFLLDGGASCFTLLPGQSVRCGATVANLNADHRTVSVRVTVNAPGSAAPVWTHAWTLDADGQTSPATPPVEWTVPAGTVPADGDTVTTELREGGALVDRLQQKLYVWEPPTAPHFVSVGADDHFRFSGSLWRPCGVNYAPSSGIAQETDDLFQHWLDPAAYDPETVERDLYHIQDLGFNAVSAWVYPGDADWQNLLDFLRRCRAHNLKVSLMLAPQVSSPDAADGLGPLITRFRLPENDTVMAYEVAWEPEFGDHDARRSMDAAWQQWVTAHYGTVAAAEAAWQIPIPRDASGNVTNPADADLTRPDGPAAALCVAYRRFLDDWLADDYGPITQRLHEIDPHHLVSFRMNHAGDPTDKDGMPYSFEGLSRAVDYLAPEAYGRVGDWNAVRPGWFTAAYARAVVPGKPLVWAEVGTSVWDDAMPENPDKLAFQGRFYDDFFRMATTSGADGLFFWWFPGGYRFNEKSDYGLLNPDGTDRPASLAVRHDIAAFLSAPAPAPPDVWLPFNRNTYGNGLPGVYDALANSFWSAIAQGHHPGLRVQSAPQ